MLTDKAIQKLKPRDVLYRVADGDGLCIEITPGGSRLWRYRYRAQGVARMLALGKYPEVSLMEAREAMRSQRALLRVGVDPSAKRKQDKLMREFVTATTFEAVGREWLGKQGKLAPITLEKAT